MKTMKHDKLFTGGTKSQESRACLEERYAEGNCCLMRKNEVTVTSTSGYEINEAWLFVKFGQRDGEQKQSLTGSQDIKDTPSYPKSPNYVCQLKSTDASHGLLIRLKINQRKQGQSGIKGNENGAVLCNIVHVIVSGMVFLVLINGGQEATSMSHNPLLQSFKDVVTTSFGSICCGSPFTIDVRTLHWEIQHLRGFVRVEADLKVSLRSIENHKHTLDAKKGLPLQVSNLRPPTVRHGIRPFDQSVGQVRITTPGRGLSVPIDLFIIRS
ncbi:choline transporter-like protein [Tanacetum coccineum]